MPVYHSSWCLIYIQRYYFYGNLQYNFPIITYITILIDWKKHVIVLNVSKSYSVYENKRTRPLNNFPSSGSKIKLLFHCIGVPGI